MASFQAANMKQLSCRSVAFLFFRHTSWLEAEEVCIISGGHLASIESHNVHVQHLISRNMATSYWNSLIFIGLNDMDQVRKALRTAITEI